MGVVDRRDPYAAHHSERVGALARRLAEEVGVSPAEAEAARIAGTVMNLGKILVPEGVLTREAPLSDAERRKVRESLQATADLLQDVEFDAPVVDTLRQAQERVDGSGPRGLAGDRILMPARIIAVANAFVGMVSPRAHRPGMDLDAAVGQLMDGVGTAYDRGVVAALVSYLDNRGGRAEWQAGG